MRRRTLSIQCTECGTEVFSYVKFGKGHLIRCWKQRILTDNSKTKEGNVLCSCGNVVGVDEGFYIKIRQHQVNIK